jgi:hypothetical protein
MSLMYQGHARLHQARSTSHDKDDLYAGLVLEGTRSMRGHVCHNTQIPDVVACMEDDNPNKDWKFQKALNHDEANLLTHVQF